MPNTVLGDLSKLVINGNEMNIKDATLTETVEEIIYAIQQNNQDISDRINDLNDRTFDNIIKISSNDDSEISAINDGLYKIQYVTITGEGEQQTETLNNSAILIQQGTHQYLYKDGKLSNREKTNNIWGDWITFEGGVTSVNGQTGAVTLSIPTKTSDITNDSGFITDAGVTSFNGSTGAVTYTAPVTSVDGKTGAVTIEHPITSVNGQTGAVTIDTGVTSFNGQTGAVTYTAPVTSVNGQTGAVAIDTGVTSFNGQTGAVTYTAPVTSVNGQTGTVTIDAGVTSFNGQTGAVTYTAPVTSVNGQTGAVTIYTGGTYLFDYTSDSPTFFDVYNNEVDDSVILDIINDPNKATNTLFAIRLNNDTVVCNFIGYGDNGPIYSGSSMNDQSVIHRLTLYEEDGNLRYNYDTLQDDSDKVIAEALIDLNDRLEVVEGISAGDENIIEAVKVNGTTLVPDANKAVNISVPVDLADLTDDATHRLVTDTEKSTWNNKVTSVNGQTGTVTIDTGVTSFNGQTGAVTYTAPVTSVNDQTGAVTLSIPTKTSDLTNDSNFATTSYVSTAISNLVDSAPTTLDTLNELAAALGNDPNFATTITNQIAEKYTKLSTGIPKTDLASDVQASLGKADTALQSYTETDPTVPAHVKSITQANITSWNSKTDNVGTITGIKMNGSTVGTAGIVDLGTVITSHQDISNKVDKIDGKGLSTNDYTTAEKEKLASIEIGDLSDLTTAELNSIFSGT